jgi:hypothetical protein
MLNVFIKVEISKNYQQGVIVNEQKDIFFIEGFID